MTLASILLVGAALVSVLAPPVLERMPFSGIRPNVVLASWLASMVSVLFFAISAVVILLWPEHAPAEGLIDTMVRCFSAVQHTARPWITESVAVLGVVTVLAFIARIVFFARRQAHVRTRMQNFHRDVVAIVARTEEGRTDVMWLDHPLPMAYSVDGRPGFVVATEGLSSSLSSVERDAVLAHEHAHLRDHHHLIVSVCEVLARVFPAVPLFARAPGAVRTVIELAADDHAARATSPAVVRSALTAVADAALPQPAWTLGLGEDVNLRLWRLRSDPQTRYSRLACCAAAAVTIALPAAAALAVVLAATMTACIMLA